MPGSAPLDTHAFEHEDPDTAALLSQVYEELRTLARRWFAQQPRDHTLQPTALIHEAYLRLADHCISRWRSRTHFYAMAARAMRQVLVDHARKRAAGKRGRRWARVALGDATGELFGHDVDLLELNDAMELLGRMNQRQCRIVELRFMAGLSVEEAAQLMSLSARTVKLDWRMARAWLLNQLGPDASAVSAASGPPAGRASPVTPSSR
jgi:RNA polymerase sigma factor (TIGR02999 family)